MKKRKANETTVMQRRELVQSYWLRGVKPWNIAATLKVSRMTIYRDLDAIQMELAKAIQGRRIYSIQRCMAELDEEWREAWILYHRPPGKDVGRRGEVVILDDRPIKTLLLGRVHEVIVERARISGFYSPKVQEQIIMEQSPAGQRIILQRLTFEEQLQRGVEELENNEGLARSEGLLPSN
jgi:hypothetical protein